MKRTLVTKLSSNVSYMREAQITAVKQFWSATFGPMFDDVSFELIEEDEESQVKRMLHRVQQEFKVADASPTSDEVASDEQH